MESSMISSQIAESKSTTEVIGTTKSSKGTIPEIDARRDRSN